MAIQKREEVRKVKSFTPAINDILAKTIGGYIINDAKLGDALYSVICQFATRCGREQAWMPISLLALAKDWQQDPRGILLELMELEVWGYYELVDFSFLQADYLERIYVIPTKKLIHYLNERRLRKELIETKKIK